MPLKMKKVRSGVKIRGKSSTVKLERDGGLKLNGLTNEALTVKTAKKLNTKAPKNDIDKNPIPNTHISLLGKSNCPAETNLSLSVSSSTSIDNKILQQGNDNQVLLVGDLVWSKIPGHSWWPSMISYDPCNAVYFIKSKNGKDACKYHVQFFGDKSLRGWVSKSTIIKYMGKDHFLSLPSKFRSKIPSSKQKVSWENAIKQADKALLVSRKERMLKFMYSYDDSKQSGEKIEEKEKHVNPSQINKIKNRLETKTNKNVLKELIHHNAKVEETSNNDSGIEDLSETGLEVTTDEEPNSNKRKRKQKVYEDYHTGFEMTLAIKSTTWKPMPALNEKNSPRKRKSQNTSPNKPVVEANTQIEREKENLTAKRRGKKSDAKQNITVIETSDSQVDLGRKVSTSKRSKKGQVSQKSNQFTEIASKQFDDVNKVPINQIMKSKRMESGKTTTPVVMSIPIEPTPSEDGTDKNTAKVKRDEKEIFCSLCEETIGDLIPCSGQCFRYFHTDCLGLGCKPKNFFTCDECETGHHACFLCKETGELIKCSQVNCGKFFHSPCIDKLQEQKSEGAKSASVGIRFYCPHHSCKICNHAKATTKTGSAPSKPASKLVKCIRCPTAYHQRTCFIAGCLVLTPNLMICDQHYEEPKAKKNNSHINVTWCFVCSHGGSLVCCDTCPASFHPECSDDLDGIPEGAWKCKDCREHNKPKYGEIVWVKFGVYRWWPGKICFPEEIPERIQHLPHSLGEFPVMFFGSNDYCWTHSGRVFRYEEGDKGGNLSKSTSLGKYFTKAIDEAKLAYEEFKKEQAQLSESLDKKNSKKPPPYRSIKVNRPVNCVRTILDQSEWPICECTQKEGCTGESECLNRMLYFECNSKTCEAGQNCNNQRMQKFQSKQLKPFKCEGKGWGLKAAQDIKIGDFVIEYVGELIDVETCQRRVKEYHENDISDYYFLTIDKDNIIDAYPKGNLSRFMNHSCDPNCETQKWTVNGEVRVGLFANKDINQGDELCFNYHLDSLGNDKKQCKCGATNCSGYLGVKPKSQHAISMAEKAAKNKKTKEKKRKRSRKPKVEKIVHEDDCFICGDGGDLILCSRLKCTKSYHLKCLALDKIPHGKWECPWHFCDVCGKNAKAVCSLCTNSYCAKHQEGELFPLRENITVCSEHSEEEFRDFLTELDKKKSDMSGESSDSSNKKTSDVSGESSDSSELDVNNNVPIIEIKTTTDEMRKVSEQANVKDSDGLKPKKSNTSKRRAPNTKEDSDTAPPKKKSKSVQNKTKSIPHKTKMNNPPPKREVNKNRRKK